MSMIDLSLTTAPKSDQLNADDLVGGPKTLTITRVVSNPNADKQKNVIYYEGDNGKPWKPCVTSVRHLVECWGPDGSIYPGRQVVVYRDTDVEYGNKKDPGIRIHALSDIPADRQVVDTIRRGVRKTRLIRKLLETPPTTAFDLPRALTAITQAAARADALALARTLDPPKQHKRALFDAINETFPEASA